MTVPDILSQLESLGNPKVREYNSRNGAGDKQFGVKLGDLRTIAKSIKTNHELAKELWQTGIADAMLLAILVIEPKKLSLSELEEMVKVATFTQLADWVNSYVVKAHPQKEEVRESWMNSDDVMLARAGWSLTAERVSKSPEGIDAPGLLERIEKEMGLAPVQKQWTMNFVLAEIGINFPELRQHAIDIGEKLGVFRDYPTSKGCTSPFAPIWINAMVARK